MTSSDVVAVEGYDSVSAPDIVRAGPGYGLLFTGRVADGGPRERNVVILDAEGIPTGDVGSLGVSTRAALAGGPHELGIVLGNGGDIEVHVRDLEGREVGSPTLVATGPSDADWPDITWGGDSFLVAYSDDVAGAGLDDIYIARVCPLR